MSAPRLKNRNGQIPNGLTFYLPQTKWKPRPWSSFDVICQGLATQIKANPALAAKHKWPQDPAGVADWVDLYNATVCAKMGWTQYIVDDAAASLPKASAPHQAALLQSLKAAAAGARALVAGAKSLIEWEDSGEDPVSPKEALERAIICSQCPHNQKGDFTAWFTVPASELIKRRVEKARARHMTTPRDDDLNLCDICHCPLKLKVWVPMPWILKRLSRDILDKLKSVPGCWVGGNAASPSPAKNSSPNPG